MIKAVLWDIDATLLDFKKPESVAIKKCFGIFKLGECTDEMVEYYSHVNGIWWGKLERGELSKKEILVGRFTDLLEHYGLDSSIAPEFNETYQEHLGEVVDPIPHGLETMRALRGKVIQCIVTNGTVKTQNCKMKTSGIDKLADKVFISDEVGFEKPDKRFFDAVLNELKGIEKQEIMIVGDSLTSDMTGGNNAGIICCWYNPSHKEGNQSLKIDYEITDLAQVKEIINELA